MHLIKLIINNSIGIKVKTKFLFLILFCVNLIFAQEKTFYFDIGTKETDKSDFSNVLSGDQIYSLQNKSGWDRKYENQFQRDLQYSRSVRNALTYDGIADKEIKYKIDLPKGDYLLTYWIEVGFDKEGNSKFFANGVDKKIIQHQLKEDEEGQVRFISQYRVINTEFQSAGAMNELFWK